MAKPSTMHQADSRPRVYMRQRGDRIEATAVFGGPYTPITTLHDAIDLVDGDGAHLREAVIIWEGVSYDG